MLGSNFFLKVVLIVLFQFGYSNTIAQASIKLHNNKESDTIKINKNIQGMFSEHLGGSIYGGIWVGENSDIPNYNGIRTDVVEALKKINVPLLRWPGGCFADAYHWKDGIGPKEKRPDRMNNNWGGVVETNEFGTHEFMKLVEMLGAEAYLGGNVGSGTVEEMSQWIEYLNSDKKNEMSKMRREYGQEKPWGTKYWGVGNESWGCGGNMTPKYYSNQYRKYASFINDYPGASLKKIASGPNGDDTNWTEVLMENIPNGMMWGISLHYYTIPTGEWENKGSEIDFDEDEYFTSLKNAIYIEDIIEDHIAIMDKYDPEEKVNLVVDEWGVWTDDADPEDDSGYFYQQQNTLRDALVASSTLNIFNNHSDRIKMANLAQTVNVLQSVILTNPNNSHIVLTPTYYVFDMYKAHQDAKLIPIDLESSTYENKESKIPAVNASASIDSTDAIHITFSNLDPNKDNEVNISFKKDDYKKIEGEVLTSDRFNDYNDFNKANTIEPRPFSDFVMEDNQNLKVTLPSKSVVKLEMKQ